LFDLLSFVKPKLILSPHLMLLIFVGCDCTAVPAVSVNDFPAFMPNGEPQAVKYLSLHDDG
jgi:hypothetical protein